LVSRNYNKEYPLRYGENPQQKAVALVNDKSFVQLGGEKKLSYNNLLDLDAAINIAYNSSSKKISALLSNIIFLVVAQLKKDNKIVILKP
jgi:AICAR transformylase/IMP cyclohydrolase PurH